MASITPNATAEELEDELVLQQAFLESLADLSDDDISKREIKATIAILEQRLQECLSSGSQSHSIASDAEVVDSNDSDESLSISGDTLSKRPASSSPYDQREVKRRAHDASGSSANRASAAHRKVFPSNRTLEKQRLAEEVARRRYREEQADAAFALQLSQQGGDLSSDTTSAPHISGPSNRRFSVSSAQSASNHAIDSPGPADGPSRTLPWATAGHGNPSRVKHESPGRSEPYQLSETIVDLTSSTDDEEYADLRHQAGLSIGRFARTPHEVWDAVHNPQHAPSNEYHHTTTGPQGRSVTERLMYSQNFEAQRQEQQRRARLEQAQREQQLRQRQEFSNAQRQEHHHRAQFEQAQRAHQFRQRQEALRMYQAQQGGTPVYQMPGAYPGNSSASLHGQHPQATSIYERQPTKTVLRHSSLEHALSGFNDEVARLGSLIGTGSSASAAGKTSYGGSWDDEETFNDEQTLEALKNLMDNIRPDEEIPLDEREVEIESMTVKLKPYQGAGLKWLQNMEEGSNKGAILADDMGLGKTVQAIALMSTRRSEDRLRKTNLIIAPVALLRQWKEEILTKLKRGRHAMSVYIHHGSQKKKSWEELRTFDVVITTFGTIASEMRKRDIFLARLKIDRDARERPNERCLFIGEKSDWYRVIIDEAQNIKNRSTQSSRGSCLIRSQYRLCMTGTPMMNSVDELYSLIRFLNIKPYNDWQRFSTEFSRPVKSNSDERRAKAMQKLQALLKAILLRRQKKSTINGKPILVLPERIVEHTHPEFSPEERDFYTALETQQRIKFDKYVRAGTVGKSYAHILVMLLRLRQACCHPHLIKDFGVAIAADISQETMDDIAKSLDPAVVERIKASGGEFECPVCYDAVQNPAIFVPCGHDTCADCYVKIKEAAQGGENSAAKCPNCRGLIDPKKVLDWETFQKIHIPVPTAEDLLEQEAVKMAEEGSSTEIDDDDDETESDSETETDSETESLDGFIVDDDVATEFDENDETNEEDGDDNAPSSSKKGKRPKYKVPQRPGTVDFSDTESEAAQKHKPPRASNKGKMRAQTLDEAEEFDVPEKQEVKRKRKHKGEQRSKDKGKGKAKSGREKEKKKKVPQRTLAELKKLSSRNKGAKREYLRRLRQEFEMSTKIQTTTDLIKQIIDETDEKIIVFSQWTSLLDLLEIPIDEHGWVYQRYDGSMSARDRADAIDEFKSTTRNPQVRLMLVSLKAGNAGLNLNCASQVIILDPFWNPYIEEQAIDRAHRLGQEREVHVHRLLIEETVEDRIMALQEQKRQMINEALDEGAGQRLSRLSVAQLGYLFGIKSNAPDVPAAITAGGN